MVPNKGYLGSKKAPVRANKLCRRPFAVGFAEHPSKFRLSREQVARQLLQLQPGMRGNLQHSTHGDQDAGGGKPSSGWRMARAVELFLRMPPMYQYTCDADVPCKLQSMLNQLEIQFAPGSFTPDGQ